MIVFIASKGSYTEMIQTEISVKEAFPEARVERLPEMNPGKVLNEILAVCREPFFLALYGGDTVTPAIKEELMSRIADMHPDTGAVVLHPKGRSRPGSKQGFDAPTGSYGGPQPSRLLLMADFPNPAISPSVSIYGSKDYSGFARLGRGKLWKPTRLFLPKRFAPGRPCTKRLTMTSSPCCGSLWNRPARNIPKACPTRSFRL